MLPNANDEPVHLVVNLGDGAAWGCADSRGGMGSARRCRILVRALCRGWFHVAAANRRQSPFKQLANLFVGGLRGENFVPFENPPSVGVHHEDGMVSGVEKNRIRRLGADAVQRQQFLAKLVLRLSKEFVQRTAILSVQKSDECYEPLGFLAEIT